MSEELESAYTRKLKVYVQGTRKYISKELKVFAPETRNYLP